MPDNILNICYFEQSPWNLENSKYQPIAVKMGILQTGKRLIFGGFYIKKVKYDKFIQY